MCIYYFINFRSHQFFSLFSVHNDLNSSSYFPQMHINTPRNRHIHTDKSTHKHTHTQTNPHRQTNREIDRCLWSLVRGSAGEEVIWVVELGSWIGQWRKDLGRGAWFVDRLMKKGSGSPELGSWIDQWRKDLGRQAWFVDRPVKKGPGEEWKRKRDQIVFERERERERERWSVQKKWVERERESAYVGKG